MLVCSEHGLAHDTPLWVCLTVNTKQYEQALGLRVVQRLCDKYLGTHTHVTRHSFSHAMIQAGAMLPELQDRLGHESLATTGIYAKVFTGAKIRMPISSLHSLEWNRFDRPFERKKEL